MLIRICLIVAVVAGLATAGLGFIKVGEKIKTLTTNLAEQTAARATAESERDTAKQSLEKTSQELETTKTDLASARENLEKETARAATQERRATQLANDLTEVRNKLNDAQAKLNQYEIIGFSPAQVAGMSSKIRDLELERDAIAEEKKVLARTIKRQETKILILLGGEAYRPPLPEGLKGEVLVVDPKWDFVVLNIGEEQGVLENGEMLVNRNGRLVAKVRIKTVEKDRCIANVLPGFKLGDVMEKDTVLAY